MSKRRAFRLTRTGLILAVVGMYVAAIGDGHHALLYEHPHSELIFFGGVGILLLGVFAIMVAVKGLIYGPEI